MLIWNPRILQNDATIALANTATMSCNYYFFFVVRTFKIYSLRNFHVYNTVLLAAITVLHIRSPGLIYHMAEVTNTPAI